MVRRSGSGPSRRRRWYVAACIGACLAVGAIAAALVLPQYFSNATATGVSTIYKTATNETDRSTASSPDAPGGAKKGTAKPGDTLKWVVGYQNDTTANATVALTDTLKDAGTYIAGSLELPPNQSPSGTTSPQYSTDAGASWKQGVPPAGASGLGYTKTLVPSGTQQLSPPFAATTSTAIRMSGGDAYNAVVRNGLVYVIYHHNPGPFVYCARLTGATCPGWPTTANVQSWSATPGTPIGTGTPFAGNTSQQDGAWISGTRMYWYVGPADGSSAGVACLDLSTPTPTSCGYTPRTGKVVSNLTFKAQVGGTGMPASNGNYYSATTNNGAASIMCVTPTAGACTGVPSLLTGVTSPAVYASATFGDYVFASVQQTTSSSWLTYCYNVNSGLCSGSWPQTTSTSQSKAGTPYAPVLTTIGTLSGICTITNGAGTASKCWDLQGVPLFSNPYGLTGANFNAGGNGSGDAFVVGTKVYVSTGDAVMCRNFAAYVLGTVPDCAGFTRPANLRNYTVRSASDVGTDCLVATGDGGEITLFNGLTGGSCATSAPLTLTVTPQSYYCGTGAASFVSWGKLSLPGLVPTAYASVAVSLRDQANQLIPNFDNRSLAPGASLGLAAVLKTVTAITATVTVQGVLDPVGVRAGQLSISWVGDPPQMCFRTTAPPVACDAAAPRTLSNTATAVTTSATGSDAPGGNTTGAAQFTEQPIASQCSLAIAKTSPVQTARPGDKVAYAVTVRNTGSQAYDRATFSDDLADVLKEATFVGDHAASAGSVSYAQPVLSWSGALASGATATITYSMRVISPDNGDHQLVNTVVSPTTGSNCASGSTDAACSVTVEVRVTDVLWHKTDATQARNVLPGAAWTFTPVDDAGRPSGSSLVVTDCDEEAANLCSGPDVDPVGGVFRLTGFGPGTYHLVETRAPVGFRIDPTPIPVTISATMSTVTLPEAVNHQMPVPLIPLTGGLGSDLLTYSGAGLLIAVASLAVWQVMRRRRSAA